MISFLIVSLAVSIILISNSVYLHNNHLTHQVKHHLKTIVNLKVTNLEQYADLKKQRAIDFSSDGFIKEKLIELAAGGDFHEIEKELHSHIKNNKIPLGKEIYEIYILNNNGDVISEIGHEDEYEREEEEESEFHEDPLYLVGKTETYFTSILFDEEFGAKGFAVSAPILNNGKLLGVIILKFGLNELFDITLDREGLGETGETFIVNEEEFLVTPSKFLKGEEKGVLVQTIETEDIVNCFDETIRGHSKKNEPVIYFLDYRGEEVIGTHREVSDVEWCLIIKIDKNEALDVILKDYITRQIVVGLILVLVLTLIGFFTGKYFEKKREKR